MHHRDGNSLGLKLSSDSSQASTVFPSVAICLLWITFFRTAAITYRHKLIFSMVKFELKKFCSPIFLQNSHMFKAENVFPCRFIFSNQKVCGNQQTFIASHSLKGSLKSVLLSKEICVTIPKKGKNDGTLFKYVQRDSQKYEAKAVSLAL